MADESRPPWLALIAERAPEGDRHDVVVGDDRRQPDRAAFVQATLTLPHERPGEAPPAPIRSHGQPVEAAPPPIPGRNQRPHQEAFSLGDEQRLTVGARKRRQPLGGLGEARGAGGGRP